MKKTTVAAVLVTGTVLAAGIFAKCDVFEEKAIADVRTEDEAEKARKKTAVPVSIHQRRFWPEAELQ